MKAKKLIEVALPIKEISAESVRDKSIRHGHISTLHLWWARRPLPTCRAIIFASLVPDPQDEFCPNVFREAIEDLLCNNPIYNTYPDIPYTGVYDPMPDNLRNRLLMFIGKFSPLCQKNMLEGKNTPSKDQIQEGCLIKWESKNDEKVLHIARKLIWIAYNSERSPQSSYKELSAAFEKFYNDIKCAEEELYKIPNRHLCSPNVIEKEQKLRTSIDNFQNRMPSVLDPFAGGGAIPLEAARLGCRSFGNDINPVAHIIEKGSTDFPQRYGKPITFTHDEFISLYGKEGLNLYESKYGYLSTGNFEIPNRLSFDVEYFGKKLLESTKAEVGHFYPKDSDGHTPIAYYWARVATCSNPSCKAKVPFLKQFYLSKSSSQKVYLNPIIKGKDIQFEILKGSYDERLLPGWNNRGNLTCPCCGSVTSVNQIKQESIDSGLDSRLIAIITEGRNGKEYKLPPKDFNFIKNEDLKVSSDQKPTELLNAAYTQALPCCTWGILSFGDMFNNRQLKVLNCILSNYKKLIIPFSTEYSNIIKTYLAIVIDKLTDYYNSFCTWHVSRQTIGHLYSKQAIPMIFDYAETNVFSNSTGCMSNMIEWVTRYIESESKSPFSAIISNCSSGEREQFKAKSITAVVTDPPYYDAIAYADISDFFYSWLKRTLGDIYPLNFSTPQTPKLDECTALKHHHHNSEVEAKTHFENKLTKIFDAIQEQTSDIVSIMFAHQSTEAWTTLCNSILGAKMNITGSWPMDTEMANRSIGLAGAALESSVTVSCRPSERIGFGDFKDVKNDIEKTVSDEVESLYELGFRGADLLTACFGQAVSKFGKYKIVEKADGSEVSVSELLEIARNIAFEALLHGVQGDVYTKFYIGWLQLNGTSETAYDDATKFTRVGVNVDINDIKHKRLLILEGNKMHLAMAKEHISSSSTEGLRPTDSLISQAHRAILLYRQSDRGQILSFVRDVAPDSTSPLWRLLATLKELLPAGEEVKDVQGFLQNAEDFRQNCHKEFEYKQGFLFNSTYDDTIN